MSTIYKLYDGNGNPMDAGYNLLIWIPSTQTWADGSSIGQPVYLTKNSTNSTSQTSVSGVNNGDTIRGYKGNNTSQRGQFVHSDVNINTAGNTFADSSYGAGAEWRFDSTTVGSGPTVNITSGRTNNRIVTAAISNVSVTTLTTVYLIDENVIITPQGQPAQWVSLAQTQFSSGGGSTGTITWEAPSDQLTGTRSYRVVDNLTYVSGTSTTWGNANQQIDTLNPGWDISPTNQWTLNGTTLSVDIYNGTCIEGGDEFYIGDSQGNVISNATTHTVTNYTGPWGSHYSSPVSLSGTIPLNTTETYNVYIKSNTASTARKAVNWTSTDEYQYNAYTITNVQWSTGGTNNNDIDVTWTNNNIGNILGNGIELWQTNPTGASNPLQTTTTGNSFVPVTITQNTDFKLVYNGADVTGSAYSAQYTAPATFGASFGTPTITNYGAVWSIPVTYTNATAQSLSIYIDRNGTVISVNPTFSVNGSGTSTFSTNHSANASITLQNGDILKSTYFTHTYTISGISSPPPAGSVTITGANANSWTESNPGGSPNNLEVAFQVANTTSTDAVFQLWDVNQSQVDTATMTAGQSGTITLQKQNAGLSADYSVIDHNNATLLQYTTAATSPPAPSTTPSGGGPKRYPMILTHLFNKKRSFYSIGMTHKDGQLDCFL